MDLRRRIPWLCWELLFSMLCMLFMHKGRYFNLDLMIFGDCVVTMITLMFLYVCMYVVD